MPTEMRKKKLHVNGVPLTVYGEHDAGTLEQMTNLMQHGSVVAAALLPDGHRGYSQPIGGVVAYSHHISVSGVGVDIGCGVSAVGISLTAVDLQDREKIAEKVNKKVHFGIGGQTEMSPVNSLDNPSLHEVLRSCAGSDNAKKLLKMGHDQFGSVGGGNHYLMIGEDQSGMLWITTHFGSRGFGYNISNGFANLAQGRSWDDRAGLNSDDPVLLDLESDLGIAYKIAMEEAARYAAEARSAVLDTVVDILGGQEVYNVACHHNYSFTETYGKDTLQVVRKGATPISKGSPGVVGSSMTGPTVILDGTQKAGTWTDTIGSTVHGTGRVMGRMEAKGKRDRKTGELVLDAEGNPKRPGKVTPEMMFRAVREADVVLSGGDLDESPFAYRKLEDVLPDCENVQVITKITPRVVFMAPSNVVDPYKD